MSAMYFVLPILAYFLGAVPFGIVIGKVFCKTDVRASGSKNIGATNVMRLCGISAGIATFLLDALKGAVIIIISRLYFPVPHLFEILICAFAILGHAFSPYLKFKGGKAVATSFACLLVLYPDITVNIALFWVMLMLVFNVVGLASVTSALLLIFSSVNIVIFSKNVVDTSFLICVALLIIFKHIPNIKEIRKKLKAITQPDS